MQFSFLGKFTGVIDDEYWPCDLTLSDAMRICRAAGLDCDDEPGEIGDSEYAYLADESPDHYSVHMPDNWFSRLQDFQASGIIDRDTFTRLIDDLGAYADSCETMGTLGGPANPIGLAPDISFEIESQALIASVRVTPLPSADTCDESTGADRWERVRAAVLSVYGT